MKCTPAEALESEFNIVPTDLRLQAKVKTRSSSQTRFNSHISKYQKISINVIQIPLEIPPSMNFFLHSKLICYYTD